MSQAGIINIIESNPTLAVFFEGNTGTAIPFFNVIRFIGAGGITTSASGNTVTITAPAAVLETLTGDTGGTLNPTANNFNILGGSGAAGTIPVQVNGAVSTLTVNVQKSQAIAASNATNVGLAAFNSAQFSVDANGFVSLVAAGPFVTSVSGTLNRITSTGGATPVIDIAATYVGQTSITTLGTITTGTWNGTAVDATHGGTAQTTYATGDTLYASGVNTLAKLAAGSNGQVLTLAAGVPSWATPTTGTVTSVSGTANRITSTGGATPVIDISASYVGQSSITTLGTITTGVWNGTAIDLAHGGTNANLTASNGGIFYSTATAGAILAGTATAGQIIRSGASAAPTWSKSTYPATNAINTLLYASSANVMAALATANSGVLTTSSTGVPSIDTTNFAVLSTGVQVKGNNTNTAPPAGFIGEQIRSAVAAASAVTLSNTVAANVTSISLTAGIWDVTGIIGFNGTPTGATGCNCSISTTSATEGTGGDNKVSSPINSSATNDLSLVCPAYRLTLAGTTTVYLVALSVFTGGSQKAYGRLSATRVG